MKKEQIHPFTLVPYKLLGYLNKYQDICLFLNLYIIYKHTLIYMQESSNSNHPYAIITVVEPVLQKGPNNEKIAPYVTYLITGKDPHGEFNIRRRFREFLLLRNKFVQRFIGMYIPPIPSKRQASKTQDRHVEQRRRFLNNFCVRIADKPYLFDSDIFQTFIRGDPDFERASKFISGTQYALLANIYNLEFKQAAESANLPNIIIQIESQAEMLKQVQSRLTSIRNQIITISQAKSMFTQQYSKCKEEVMPQFQSQIMKKHGITDEKCFYLNNQNYKEKLKEYLQFAHNNPLMDYAESLSYDIREAQALLQAIESRRIFEDKKASFENVRRQSKQELQKLKAGRMSIKSLFTSGNKEAQIKELETYIPQYQRNEALLGICLPLSAISIHQDIQKYKKSRAVEYLTALQAIALKQLRLLDLYGEMLNATECKQRKDKTQASEVVKEKAQQ